MHQNQKISQKRSFAGASRTGCVFAVLALSGALIALSEPARPSFSGGYSLPPIKPLFDSFMRDPSICLASNGTYYLTGTTGEGSIRVWESRDLKKWDPLGVVWSIKKDGTWQSKRHAEKKCHVPEWCKATGPQVWAPEIHWIKDTFWIPYSLNCCCCGLLKSTTGRIEGPYVDVKTDEPLIPRNIDASLFQDDDGKVYYVYQNGIVARMKEDMSSLDENPCLLKPADFKHVGHEAACLIKIGGKYHLLCAEWFGEGKERTYDCMAASSDSLYGPYGDRYLAIPHGGHNMLFKDREGKWWSTFFGNDDTAPFRQKPGILRIEIDEQGRIRPLPELDAPAR